MTGLLLMFEKSGSSLFCNATNSAVNAPVGRFTCKRVRGHWIYVCIALETLSMRYRVTVKMRVVFRF